MDKSLTLAEAQDLAGKLNLLGVCPTIGWTSDEPMYLDTTEDKSGDEPALFFDPNTSKWMVVRWQGDNYNPPANIDQNSADYEG